MSIDEPKVFELASEARTPLQLIIQPDHEFIEAKMGKETCRFKKSDLWGIVFLTATPEQQANMTPIRQTKVNYYERIMTITIPRDMRKGEKYRFKHTIPVDVVVAEGLQGMLIADAKKGRVPTPAFSGQKSASGIIVPN